MNFTDLSYQISYSVSANTVVLLTNVMMSYDRNVNNVYSVMIQNETYFVSGVTVSVFVHAVNGTRYGPLSVAMDNASGSEYIAATYLYAYSLSLPHSLHFTFCSPIATPLPLFHLPFLSHNICLSFLSHLLHIYLTTFLS